MKIVERISNWPAALNRYIEANRSTVFDWGKHDCLLFSAGAIAAQTGIDPGESFRGKYSSEDEAQSIINDAGGWPRLIADQMELIGARRISSSLAQRGDIVFTKIEDGRLTAGVCVGTHAAFAGPTGLVFVQMTKCQKQAWRIG